MYLAVQYAAYNPFLEIVMPPPNVNPHAPMKSPPKANDPVDPATQPLTVSIQLATTADQLGTILGGLGVFIPLGVTVLDIDIHVDSGPPTPPA